MFFYKDKCIINIMKVVVFGSNGMLGNYVRSYLSPSYEVISLTRKDYDLSQLSIDSLTDFLKSKKLSDNDVVINCAGVIPQASKQRGLNTRLYFTINSLFPVVLSQICDRFGAKMIHITTDCVFSGQDGKYDENAAHDETNDYGMSKSLGELCKATIIRTSIIGGEMNNKRSLLEWVRFNSGGRIYGYTNHYWNGVTCLQLSKIVKEIIENNMYWNGVRHVFSPRTVTKHELVSMINDIYEFNIRIRPFDADVGLDKSISTVHGTNNKFGILGLKEQIREMREYEFV